MFTFFKNFYFGSSENSSELIHRLLFITRISVVNFALNSGIEIDKLQEDEAITTTNPTSAEQLSVRERMQRFNRMASETDLHARPNETTVPARKRADKVSAFLFYNCAYVCEALQIIKNRESSV